jgi:hypothetical protein
MRRLNGAVFAGALAVACALGSSGLTVHADQDKEDKGKKITRVFVIAMENHNWTQPS